MKNKLEDLIDTLKILRSPNGCDWNQAQTHETLIPYLLEECYEVIEAIENEDYELLKEELGDLLLHIIFQAELADEKNHFNIYNIIFNINQKLIKRKPHIFSNSNNKKKKENWEIAKKNEKNRRSVLEGVPKSLPSPIWFGWTPTLCPADILMLPSTTNFSVGLVVPIPTFPPPNIVSLSSAPVFKFNAL